MESVSVIRETAMADSEAGVSSPVNTPMISQRIVSVDFYSQPPNYLFDQVKNDFNRTELHWVPVLRIFGATAGGQKACAHIHGVFPYLYIKGEGVSEKDVAQKLDEALNRTSPHASKRGIKHVVHVSSVKGRSFYGYHKSDELFLKIHFYTPFAVTKASQLLANGSILDRKFQLFESHIPYILQFFLDYNLFGMNLIHYKKVLFRRKQSQTEFGRSFGSTEPRSRWSYDEMGEQLFQPESIKRMTRCELEFDVLAEDILNRLEKRSRNSNPGIAAIWQDEMERRRKNGILDWANIPVPISQERSYCGDIFEAELAYRKTLITKLQPFNYLSKLAHQNSQLNTSAIPDDLPASSQLVSFLPQDEQEVSFSAKSCSQDQDDESVIKFLEEMALECPPDEPDEDPCILNSNELQVAGESIEVDPVDKSEEEPENEIWSQSFVSETHEEFEIMDTPPIATMSGSARTDPVCMTSRKTRDARREWNNDVLETFMIDLALQKYEPIDLETVDSDAEPLENLAPSNTHFVDSNTTVDETMNQSFSKSGSSKKLTQAQRLFPNAIIRKEHFIPIGDGSSDDSKSSSQDTSKGDEGVSNGHEDTMENQEKNLQILVKCDPDPYYTRNQIFAKFPPKTNKRDVETQVQLVVADFECQSYPVTSHAEVQTEFFQKGVSVAVGTDPVPANTRKTQTDSTTLDVVKTCGCRCNCGLQYMTALKASWEMAFKNKDQSVQTDEETYNHTPKRSRLDFHRESHHSKRYPEVGSPHRRKIPKPPDTSSVQGNRQGLSIKITEISPHRKTRPSETIGSRSPRVCIPKLPAVSSKIFDTSPKVMKHNWELSISNPAKFSPQFDAVTKLLKKKAQTELSTKRRHSGRSPIPDSPMKPVSPRTLDLSITSVYEYESPDTSEQKMQRSKAARQGLRLFEFKHQQMLTTQRENAQRRRERRELRDTATEAKYSIRETIRPLKKTPQEAFILELVEQDEKKALPDAPDYYADEILHDPQVEAVKPPDVCHFRGGNLSDDEESSQSASQTLISSQTGINSQNSKLLGSPLVEDSPKSILKSKSCNRATKRQSHPNLRRRSIRWGIHTPEEVKQIKSESSSLETQNSVYNPDISELDGPSPLNPFNACMDVSNLQTVKALRDHQFITTMCVEVFCYKQQSYLEDSDSDSCSSDSLGIDDNKWEDTKTPDPIQDRVVAIFYNIHQDDPEDKGFQLGMLAVDPCCEDIPLAFTSWPKLKCTFFTDEISMFIELLALVEKYDPDILVGYEIRNMSWGYIIDRGVALGLPMISSLSRLIPRPNKTKTDETSVEWNETINGRIVLNLWRLLRHEMTVQSYTFESAMFNILHEKVGLVSVLTLNKFWESELDRHRTVNFFCRRVQGVMEIIDKLDLINRTAELARLFGIQFFEVFSRGSQFRVESMMLRLVKSDNMIAASPTIVQRAHMRAPVQLPLIMEPYSKYYQDPVAVLDFQSLYPSIMIAYNYDYSTCLGRVEHLGKEGKFELGCLDLEVSPVELAQLIAQNEVHISPTGVAFLKPSVKRGILPEMLEQILDTRLMVKRAMKSYGNENKTLSKVLDSRQLGLKLIANVSYGYTSANFSGRMPCIEVADSIVSKGRETLERAIKLVEDNEKKWGAKVVYGDTDSMFVLFPNCSRQTAFELAQDIVDEVTRLNPKPVKLKLEKIYQPCILQTKKRYVGFSYESPQQMEPKYDAKGIETVRRDGCPAVAKILEKSLRILFTTNDQLKLRHYLQAQFQKILLGNVNLCDYTFAKEYRGWSGYKPGAVVPALSIAERLRAEDRRAEPQPKERVPYVVIFGEPNQTLIHQIRTPREFVEHEGLRINSIYYIERALIPPLNRCFSLAGIDVQKWYAEIPRRHLRVLPHENRLYGRGIMDYFLVSKNCVACDKKTDHLLCEACQKSPVAFIKLQSEMDILTRKIHQVAQTCEYCSFGVCISLDCHTWQKLVRYDRIQQSRAEVLRRALALFEDWKN
ncbi:unnamed protein product [Allacma fusca]|uniref:DNA polymerase n=1 Tax=Allacma fusca TaxID=39272 RepID=A0A8J2PMJ1_9HEXA|nr:unnamed protein product [Allacma fusca]